MARYSVELEGFTFTHADPTTGAVRNARVAQVEADCPEMAEALFKQQMGINSTVRKFKIHRLDTEAEELPPAPAPEGPKLVLDDDAGDVLETETGLAPEVAREQRGEAEPEKATTIQPVIALPDPPKSDPVPVVPVVPVVTGGKRARGKPTTLLKDPDGVREEIERL